MNDYLMHYGILGMKWGVRRYQNADGSLTAAGKKRYGSSIGNKLNKIKDNVSYKYKLHKYKKDLNRAQDIRMQIPSLTAVATGVRGMAYYNGAKIIARTANSIYSDPTTSRGAKVAAKYLGTGLWATQLLGIGSLLKNEMDVYRYNHDEDYKKRIDDLALHPNKYKPKMNSNA